MIAGFIGLGRMGEGMARNLLKSGVKLVAFDTSQTALDRIVEAGAQRVTSVADLTRKSNVIFTSLPGPAQVEDVVLGAGGVLENSSPETVLFDLSTNALELVRRIHQAFKRKDCTMLDAPVSGGPGGAASGNLVLWIGGEKGAFDQYLPLLKAFSSEQIHVGPIGAGTATKLAHNLLGYMILLAQAEAFSMGVNAGIDPLDLWQAMRFGVVGKGSPLDMLVSQFLPGKYDTPAFALKLAHKDVTLATSLGKELGVPMRLASMTLEEMTEALGRGFAEWDSRSFLQLQLQRAGVKIAVEPERLRDAVKRVQK